MSSLSIKSQLASIAAIKYRFFSCGMQSIDSVGISVPLRCHELTKAPFTNSSENRKNNYDDAAVLFLPLCHCRPPGRYSVWHSAPPRRFFVDSNICPLQIKNNRVWQPLWERDLPCHFEYCQYLVLPWYRAAKSHSNLWRIGDADIMSFIKFRNIYFRYFLPNSVMSRIHSVIHFNIGGCLTFSAFFSDFHFSCEYCWTRTNPTKRKSCRWNMVRVVGVVNLVHSEANDIKVIIMIICIWILNASKMLMRFHIIARCRRRPPFPFQTEYRKWWSFCICVCTLKYSWNGNGNFCVEYDEYEFSSVSSVSWAHDFTGVNGNE